MSFNETGDPLAGYLSGVPSDDDVLDPLEDYLGEFSDDDVGAVQDMLVGGEAIPWSQIQDFDLATRRVNADVTAWAQSGESSRVAALARWNGWYISWRAWFAQQDSERTILFPGLTGERLRAYREQERQYRVLLAELNQAGATKVDPPDSRTPTERLLGQLKWVGLVAVGAYLAAPLLPTLIKVVRR